MNTQGFLLILVLFSALKSNAETTDCNQILRAYSHYQIEPSTSQLRTLNKTPWYRFRNPIERIPTANITSQFRLLSDTDQIILRNYFAQLDHLKVEKAASGDPLTPHDLKELIQTASRLLEADHVPHRVVHLELQDAIVIEPKADGSLLNQLAHDAAQDGYQIGFSPIPNVHAYFNAETKFLSLPIESIFSPTVQNMALAHEWVHLEMDRLVQKGNPPPLSGESGAYEGERLPPYGSYFLSDHSTYFSHDEIAADLAGLEQLAHDIRATGFDSEISKHLFALLVSTTQRVHDQSVWLEIHTQQILAESSVKPKLKVLESNGIAYIEYRGKKSVDQFPSPLKPSELGGASNRAKALEEFHRLLGETRDSARKGRKEIKQFIEDNRDLFEQTALGRDLIFKLLPIIRP